MTPLGATCPRQTCGGSESLHLLSCPQIPETSRFDTASLVPTHPTTPELPVSVQHSGRVPRQAVNRVADQLVRRVLRW